MEKFKELIIQRIDCLMELEALITEANGKVMTIEQTKKFIKGSRLFDELTAKIEKIKKKFSEEKNLWRAPRV